MQDSEQLIILALRQAVAEQRRRLLEIEGSSAWRAGGVVQDVLLSPLRRGPVAVWRLLQLVQQRRRNQSDSSGRTFVTRTKRMLDVEAAQTLAYGSAPLDGPRWGLIWQADDASLLLAGLERRAEPATLVLRRLTPAVMRPLARIQRLGWKLVWMPQPGALADYPHLVRHVRQLADEVVEESAS